MKKEKDISILAIETSCDETGAAEFSLYDTQLYALLGSFFVQRADVFYKVHLCLKRKSAACNQNQVQIAFLGIEAAHDGGSMKINPLKAVPKDVPAHISESQQQRNIVRAGQKLCQFFV